MIPPDKLTPENGFTDGVVVQYNGDHLGWWNEDVKHSFGLRYLGFIRSTDGYIVREIESIRPLTGPMAIWNFAPVWAVARFANTDDHISWIRVNPEWLEHRVEMRPWWAQRREE
jgi:hypothetical protein